MSRVIVRPDKLDLDSPGRRDYWVALEHDSIWGDHLIPLTVWVGPETRPGEGLVSFGSNHGNEYEGPVVLKTLLREIQLENVRGRIIFIPVLNPSAFRAGTRESSPDDRVNLNRAFVDGAGVTPSLAGITHRIAAFVRQYIWPRVHIVIDLHSGGNVARFSICANYHPVDDPVLAEKIEQTARGSGPRRSWFIRIRPPVCCRVRLNVWGRLRWVPSLAGAVPSTRGRSLRASRRPCCTDQ